MTGPDGFCRLTARQMDVLQLMADGLQCKEIARDLKLSDRTVEIHRRNLRLLLEARTTAHVVAKAMRAGLIK